MGRNSSDRRSPSDSSDFQLAAVARRLGYTVNDEIVLRAEDTQPSVWFAAGSTTDAPSVSSVSLVLRPLDDDRFVRRNPSILQLFAPVPTRDVTVYLSQIPPSALSSK